MPVILPRASFTLIDAHSVRLLRKYELEFSDVLRGSTHLRAKMEGKLLPKTLTRRFEKDDKSMRKMLTELREQLTKLDPTLGGAMDTTESKMLFQFSKLQEKPGRALALRTSLLDSHEKELLSRLYPNGGLQKPPHFFLPMLALHATCLLVHLRPPIKLSRATPHSPLP